MPAALAAILVLLVVMFADIRLAELVFAPHYAVPMPRTVARPVTLRSARDGDSAPMATLNSGDTLEVLEIAGKSAWGVARPSGLVGYVEMFVFMLLLLVGFAYAWLKGALEWEA